MCDLSSSFSRFSIYSGKFPVRILKQFTFLHWVNQDEKKKKKNKGLGKSSETETENVALAYD